MTSLWQWSYCHWPRHAVRSLVCSRFAPSYLFLHASSVAAEGPALLIAIRVLCLHAEGVPSRMENSATLCVLFADYGFKQKVSQPIDGHVNRVPAACLQPIDSRMARQPSMALHFFLPCFCRHKRLPSLPSSHLSLQAMTGDLDKIRVEDVLGTCVVNVWTSESPMTNTGHTWLGTSSLKEGHTTNR